MVIDISAVEIVDSFIGRTFATSASTSRLFDADTVVVGMRPALDLERGMRILGQLDTRRAGRSAHQRR